MARTDPFLVEPDLWFGVLCEGVEVDPQKRISLVKVFNTWYLEEPPPQADIPPYALVRCVLALGFSHGVGDFEAVVSLRDVEDRVLWTRPEPWRFRVGPGEANAAILADQVEHWIREVGNYYYVVTLTPPGKDYRVRLEIAKRPPPEMVEQRERL